MSSGKKMVLISRATGQILDVALAFYIATLTSEQRHAEPMLRISADLASESSGRCECMDVLAAMLDRPWSGDTLGEGKSAKLEKRMVCRRPRSSLRAWY